MAKNGDNSNDRGGMRSSDSAAIGIGRGDKRSELREVRGQASTRAQNHKNKGKDDDEHAEKK